MAMPAACAARPGFGNSAPPFSAQSQDHLMTQTNPNAERFEFALALIKDAGALAHSYFKKRGALTIKSKGMQDMVSEADLNTELLIRSRIEAQFPQDAFLGEETGLSSFAEGQGIWVVDPISIAFVKDGAPQFGMVYAPERDELFSGGIGFPATLNGEQVERHPGKSVTEGITGVGYSTRIAPDSYMAFFERLLTAGGMFYRDGSGALTLCYVACGRLVGYVEPHINSWDCLGAIAIIHAAGLKTNDFLAHDGLRKGNWLIAGNADVYEKLERIYFGRPAE
jgi:myo-inositol-1(or 4)-monophosphatase